MREFLFYIFLLVHIISLSQNKSYTREDSIKGRNSIERSWWDATHYEIHATFNPKDSSVSGFNIITARVLYDYNIMQIDLQEPMQIDSIFAGEVKTEFRKSKDFYFIKFLPYQDRGVTHQLKVFFHGKPKTAKMPPWDGGLVWRKDKDKNPWISIACQGMAGSVWFPCKDHMSDEPDSVSFYITASEDLVCVSNGRLRSVSNNDNKTKTWNWAVRNPINNYNIIPYIGKYVCFTDTFNGEDGQLDLSYWVLDYNLEKAKEQFKQVKSMLRCFEYWFGPYPFYEDGYKLVESPYLGMEHQSAVAYGNGYINGYMGRDLSGSGWGMKWDFIIVHESGHEWYGNNISAKDVADNWVHEGFTCYSEALYTEYLFGKAAGQEYVIGLRKNISNNTPVIGDYEVNKDGSHDMYYKGANMLHTIRQIVKNDSLWREMFREMNRVYGKQTVTTKEIEEFMSRFLNKDLSKIFDQYLRSNKIPVLEYSISKKKLKYRWVNCVNGFDMPVELWDNKNGTYRITPLTEIQEQKINSSKVTLNINYYVNSNSQK